MPQRKIWFDLHDPAVADPQVTVIGMPFDGASSRPTGAANGPGRLRAISRTCAPVTRRGRTLPALRLADLGDLPPGDAATPQAYLEAARAGLDARPEAPLSIVLGGDNSVSIAALAAAARRHAGNLGVIWFDAHPDLFETYDGDRYSHACALRTGLELGGLPLDHAVLLATRSFSRDEAAFIADGGVAMITAADWMELGSAAVADRIAAALRGRDAVYLAVDIDGFDASCAPGTGYPMPGGIGAEAFFQLLERLAGRIPLRHLDLTEVAPDLDRNDMTSFLGVQVILETIAAIAP